MKYSTTKEERELAQKHIDNIFNGATSSDLTGTTLSPYNLAEALRDNGFIEDEYDCNGADYWRYFHHPNVGCLVMFFNAESFELILEVRND